MKCFYPILRYTAALCFCLALYSCEGRRPVEGTEAVKQTDDTAPVIADEPDTARVIKTGNTADEEVEEFRAWLNQQASRGDTAIRKEWPEVRQQLRQKNAQLEEKFDSLSEKGKAEFRNLQKNYNSWEARQERRQQQPLDAQRITQWKKQLLGEYSDIEDISAATAREAYLTFMGTVRTKRKTWTDDDWDYVDHVYSQLNQRRRQIESGISTGDNIKIRTLQAEYLALEGSADTKSILRGVQ
ncbi:hypothetical protein [Pontibacter chitinilyticus]|uniref:hypothetical protein n=1 Tax=Pontibacter chitinilyticus TaxID=2674989 RepID=UPI003219C34F